MDAAITTPSGFSFFVPGDCVPWARAGGGKTGHRFTPPKQAKYAAVLKTLCLEAMRDANPLEGPVSLHLTANYPWPKSASERKRAQPGARWRTSRHALNKIAWLDDAQIAYAVAIKRYDEKPGLHVRVEALA